MHFKYSELSSNQLNLLTKKFKLHKFEKLMLASATLVGGISLFGSHMGNVAHADTTKTTTNNDDKSKENKKPTISLAVQVNNANQNGTDSSTKNEVEVTSDNTKNLKDGQHLDIVVTFYAGDTVLGTYTYQGTANQQFEIPHDVFANQGYYTNGAIYTTPISGTDKVSVHVYQEFNLTYNFFNETNNASLGYKTFRGKPNTVFYLSTNDIPSGYKIASDYNNGSYPGYYVSKGDSSVSVKLSPLPESTRVNFIYDGQNVGYKDYSGVQGDTFNVPASDAPSGYHFNGATLKTDVNNPTQNVQVEKDAQTTYNTTIKFELADGTEKGSHTYNVTDGATIVYSDDVPTGYYVTENKVVRGTNGNQTVVVTVAPKKYSTTIKFELADGTVEKTNTYNDVTDGDTIDYSRDIPTGYHVTENKVVKGTNGDQTVVVTVAKDSEVTHRTTINFVDEDTGRTISTKNYDGVYPNAPIKYLSDVPAGYYVDGNQPINGANGDQTVTVRIKKSAQPGPAPTPGYHPTPKPASSSASNDSYAGYVASNTSSSSTSSASTTDSSSASTSSTASAEPVRVYTLRKVGFYTNPSMQENDKINTFKEEKRTNRPEFKVLDKQTNSAGQVVYKVQDLNPNSKTYDKVGYITANSIDSDSLYYTGAGESNVRTNLRNKVVEFVKPRKIRVINKAIVEYANPKFTDKKGYYKKGKKLKVVSIHKLGTVYRFKLANGNYVTANKRFVKLLN